MQHTKQYSLKGFPYPLYLLENHAKRCWQWQRDIVLNNNDILDTIESFHLASQSAGGDNYVKGVNKEEVWQEWTDNKKGKGYGLEDIPAQVLQQSLKDLRNGFDTFFGGEGGYPHMKSPEDTFPSLRFPQAKQIEIHDGWVKLPKLGWVQFNEYRPVPKNIHSATVSWDGIGWKITFLVEVQNEIYDKTGEEIGIDRGVTNSIAYDSEGIYEGTMVHWGVMTKEERKQRKRYERKMARRTKNSVGYNKARKAKLKLEKYVARRVKDAQHKETTKLAKEVNVVYIDKLNLKGMTASAKGTVAKPGTNVKAKSGLNRSMREQAHGQFNEMLKYKMEIQGKYVIEVPTANSSRECNDCHYIDAKNRKKEKFECLNCGYEAHADTNAADITKYRGRIIKVVEIAKIDKERQEAHEQEIIKANRKMAMLKRRSEKAKLKREEKAKKLLDKDSKHKCEQIAPNELTEHKAEGQAVSVVTRTPRVVVVNTITKLDVVTEPEGKVSLEKHGSLGP